jgi:hypothetical protein
VQQRDEPRKYGQARSALVALMEDLAHVERREDQHRSGDADQEQQPARPQPGAEGEEQRSGSG